MQLVGGGCDWVVIVMQMDGGGDWMVMVMQMVGGDAGVVMQMDSDSDVDGWRCWWWL